MIISDPEALPRISSGNAQLDAILCGGFPANSINIIMGEPGSGKTILAEGLIFANAKLTHDPRPILYLTTLSEPLEKVVRYLQKFSFFDDEQLLSGAIRYDSVAVELEQGGVVALVPRLKEIIATTSPIWWVSPAAISGYGFKGVVPPAAFLTGSRHGSTVSR